MGLIPEQIPLDQIQDKIRCSVKSTKHMLFAAIQYEITIADAP